MEFYMTNRVIEEYKRIFRQTEEYMKTLYQPSDNVAFKITANQRVGDGPMTQSGEIVRKADGYMKERDRRAEMFLALAKPLMGTESYNNHYGDKTIRQVADEIEPLERIRLTSFGGPTLKSAKQLREQLINSDGKAIDIVWDTEGRRSPSIDSIMKGLGICHMGSTAIPYKAGDKVKMKHAKSWAENGVIYSVKEDDILVIRGSSKDNVEQFLFGHPKMSNTNCAVTYDDVTPVPSDTPHQCYCPSLVVVQSGCKCGGI